METLDIGVLILRLVVGLTLLAHGVNHIFGGGGISGTARWFEGLGLRPGPLHAWSSALIEIIAGAGITLGLLTPLSCAAGIGVMTVAGLVAHRKNGFFVFREGYEYVLVLGAIALVIAIIGPGRLSIDQTIGVATAGWTAALLAGGLGLASAAGLLAVAWRPR